jgi:hypothetical protein
MGKLLVLASLMCFVTGCALIDNMMARRAPPDNRVVLGNRQLVVNLMTHRTREGASIDDYKCGDKALMVCTSHGQDLLCECK